MTRDELDSVLAQLRDAIKYKKCWRCGCQQSFARTLREHLHDLTEAERQEVGPLLRKSEETFVPVEYDCLGCKVCFPAIATNVLSAVQPAFAVGEGCGIDAGDNERLGWPPLAGNYRVLRYHAPVAVCTLNSPALADALAAHHEGSLAIVGTLNTENLGIERLIKNVVSNANIRFLLLCGEDSRQRIGHLPGQSLASLFENGIDDHGRIVGAQGKRPFLKNVESRVVDHFRRQVRLVSMAGCTDTPYILAAARRCADENVGPFEAASLSSGITVTEARVPESLKLDPNGYFVIFADKPRGHVVLEHYSNAGVLDQIIQGSDVAAIYSTAVEQKLVSRLDHACYLGKELARAEAAMKTGGDYVQDKAPEPVCTGPACSSEGCGS